MTSQPSSTTLRPAVPTDAEHMHVIEEKLFGPDAWSPDQVQHELARLSVDRWYVVAEQNGELVGYGGIFLSPPDADVQTVAVAPHIQGAGVGRLLLAAVIDAAWQQKCSRIFLEVRADNAAALGMYQSAGFTKLGVRRRYYADGVDAVNMRLRRNEPTPLSEVPNAG